MAILVERRHSERSANATVDLCSEQGTSLACASCFKELDLSNLNYLRYGFSFVHIAVFVKLLII